MPIDTDGVTTPTTGDAPNVPADLLAMVTDINAKIVAVSADIWLPELLAGWNTLAGNYAATDRLRTVAGSGSGTTDSTGLIGVVLPFTKVLVTATAHATISASVLDTGPIQVDRRYTTIANLALCPLTKSGAFLPPGRVVEFSFFAIGV